MYRLMILCLILALPACSGESSQNTEPRTYDILLRGGVLYDGSNSPPVEGDIALNGDRIAAIGDLSADTADRVIELEGLAVMPGFIDIHSHAGDSLDDGLFRWPDAENLIRQGVTTVVGGPDGSSPLPIQDTFDAFDELGVAVNYATFVGHGSVREQVMGEEDRAPTQEELEQMQAIVAEAMQQGAFGLSSGLIYVPGRFAETDEVVALARVAGEYGGIYISHMREEGLELLDSVAETIRIGEEGGLPTQLTHHKVVGAPMWGGSEDSLRMVDEAIGRGVDVSIDQYPYTASSTNLGILFPGWALSGGRRELLERMEDPELRQRLRNDIVYNIEVDRGGDDPANVVIAECPHDESLNGMNLTQILQQRGTESSKENAADLLMELMEAGNCSAVFHAMHEDDVRNIMQHPRTMIASDGGVEAPTDRSPHPRNYGTFARLLGHYARDENVLPVHTAIHKVTQLPADRLSVDDRGRLRVGAIADIAVLDIESVIDRSNFAEPHQYAEGAHHVFVAGEPVLLDGDMTAARPGRVIRSDQYR
ncbi:MAG: N-acyl-D-amino-acid deacylase family protein [Pseudomonadota bacterium]